MTGGYSLLDFFDVNITSEPVKIEGIFKKYQASKRKAFLLGNVTINNTQLNDAFSTPYFEDGKVCFPAYDGVIKISDTDYVNFDVTADVIADMYLSKEEFLSIESDNTPYVSRTARDGIVKIPQLVGATVAWNQLVQNGNFVDTDNWVASASRGTLSASDNIMTYTIATIGNSMSQNNIRQNTLLPSHKLLCIFDVYVGVATSSGILMFSGSQQVAFIQRQIAVGWNTVNGVVSPSGDVTDIRIFVDVREGFSVGDEIKFRNVNIIDLTQMFGTTIADYVYSLETAEAGSGIAWLKSYGFFTKDYYAYDAGSLQSVCTSGRKITALDGTVRTYPIDNEELRGLFKLDANNKLYADGDIYTPSGSGTRNYEIRAYQSGDESLSDAITDGTNTVVKLATPTTFSADPYINPQRSEGTEEFVDGLTRNVMIPVGNNSTYYKDELFNIIGEYIDSCDDAVIAMIPEGE